MKCEKCREDTFLPFRCPYCGGHFCPAHRLPENHQCPQIEQARMPKEKAQLATSGRQVSYEHSYVYPSATAARQRFHFSQKEITHLAAAALLVIAVGLSLPNMAYNDYVMLTFLATMFAASFLIHEIAHKTLAQRNGLWAEFRLTPIGTVLTLLSIISPFIKIVGPGAVMVSGSADRKVAGKISIVGPVANIVIASVLCSAALLSLRSWAFGAIAFYNAWIAIFNLIPMGALDGYKVFKWNKIVWALAFALSVALGVFSYRLL